MKENTIIETSWSLINYETYFEFKLRNGEQFKFKNQNIIRITTSLRENVSLYELQMGDEIIEITKSWK